MRLGEALQIIGQAAGEQTTRVHLLCGFMPLHLGTFIKARLALRFPGRGIDLRSGLFADLEGNVARCLESGGDGAIAVVEWSDLDQRLGFRAASGWNDETLADIIVQIEEKCQRLAARLSDLGRTIPVVVFSPTLNLPPIVHTPPLQTSAFELRLDALVLEFLRSLSGTSAIKLASQSSLAMSSPRGARHDVKMELQAGFPYTLSHADAVADLAVNCLFPGAPKKGIITDLDQTLWNGILGEAGVGGVSWSLEDKSQAHSLYQQVLASLASSGVLVGIASKNDAELVQAALHRPDILLQPAQVFPVEASWGLKSDAVGRILEAWNVAADSVVFVDDSPMELAEVAEKHPGIECLQFPSDNPAGILALLSQLRAHFGKNGVNEEDRLRLQSLRASAALKLENPPQTSDDFLSRLAATVTFEASEHGREDQRAFELVNKTNQFNLNGVRYTEAEWKSRARRSGAFLATVSYEDRFGPLGRIAVLGGQREGDSCCLDIWVMSCRAFSRNIEFQAIRKLFQKMRVPVIRFRFKPTDRNEPLQAFLAHFFPRARLGEEDLHLHAADFDRLCPPLFHEVKDKWTTLESS